MQNKKWLYLCQRRMLYFLTRVINILPPSGTKFGVDVLVAPKLQDSLAVTDPLSVQHLFKPPCITPVELGISCLLCYEHPLTSSLFDPEVSCLCQDLLNNDRLICYLASWVKSQTFPRYFSVLFVKYFSFHSWVKSSAYWKQNCHQTLMMQNNIATKSVKLKLL